MRSCHCQSFGGFQSHRFLIGRFVVLAHSVCVLIGRVVVVLQSYRILIGSFRVRYTVGLLSDYCFNVFSCVRFMFFVESFHIRFENSSKKFQDRLDSSLDHHPIRIRMSRFALKFSDFFYKILFTVGVLQCDASFKHCLLQDC